MWVSQLLSLQANSMNAWKKGEIWAPFLVSRVPLHGGVQMYLSSISSHGKELSRLFKMRCHLHQF